MLKITYLAFSRGHSIKLVNKYCLEFFAAHFSGHSKIFLFRQSNYNGEKLRILNWSVVIKNAAECSLEHLL